MLIDHHKSFLYTSQAFDRRSFLQNQVRRWLEHKDPVVWVKINQERYLYELSDHKEEGLIELLSLADLAETVSQPFPYEILLKLGEKTDLAPGEEVGLKNWLDSIQRPGFTPSIYVLNKAFVGLQMLAKFPFEMQELVWQLYTRAPKLFEQKDPLYFDLITKQHGLLTPFGVEGLYLNQEGVLFGRHASDLSLRKRAAEKAWGVPFFLQEDSTVPLPERWLKDHPFCKGEHDPLFKPFLSLLTQCVREQAAPKGFSLDDLYLSGAKLYTLKPFSKGFLDIVDWEEIVVRISDGCQEVYKQLMQQSGLVNHPGFLFWKNVMCAAANPQEFDIPFEAAKRMIGDGRIVRKAELLAQQVKRFYLEGKGCLPLQMLKS